MTKTLRVRYGLVAAMIALIGAPHLGCSVNNDVPPRAAPIGQPTNPPPPRIEGDRRAQGKS